MAVEIYQRPARPAKFKWFRIPKLRGSRTPQKRHAFSVTYPDGRKRYIDKEMRDHLLLSDLIKPMAKGNSYRYIGPIRVVRSFAELENIYAPQTVSMLRRFLAGCFIFELKGKCRRTERLETPEGMALRMAKA